MLKTVYFLGAGFSRDAGGLVQNEIIQTILDKGFTQGKKRLIKAKNNFIDFIKNQLHIPEKNYSSVNLEDIFSPIDGCISNRLSYGRFRTVDLKNLRREFNMLMGEALDYSFKKNKSDCNYINKFADYILRQARSQTGESTIPIITTNWDLLLDESLKKIINQQNPKQSNFVDYCCYISPFDLADEKEKQLVLQKGFRNIKLLKLHGSMNWFQCPLCQRMFVKFGEKIELMKDAHCIHCKKNYHMENCESIKLQNHLLLPTYLKDLSNLQIKLVWQNAAIELSEASRIVFIGYSLPAADFEIRQLFARMIRPDAEIQLVLYPKGKYVDEEEKRYIDFFGNRLKKENILKMTVPEYVDKLVK